MVMNNELEKLNKELNKFGLAARDTTFLKKLPQKDCISLEITGFIDGYRGGISFEASRQLVLLADATWANMIFEDFQKLVRLRIEESKRN